MKKTYSDLFMLVMNLNEQIKDGKTKLEKKLIKFGERIKKYSEQYDEDKNEILLDNAHADADGVLLTDEKGNYRYTKEGLKKRQTQLRELLNKEFDFEPIPVINPEGLSELTFLKGWVTGVDFVEDVVEEEEEVEL
jgi:hypothetical protein